MTIHTKIARAENYKHAMRDAHGVGYLVIHFTGNKGDTAAANAAYFARERVGASAHYFVDEHEVWQSVPDADVAWHCGTKTGYFHPACRNANSIGVELCMLDRAGRVRQGSVESAVALVRSLMARYGVTASRVLRHYDVTHKMCPAPMVEDAALWARFKAEISAPVKIVEEEMSYEQFKAFMARYEAERDKLPAHVWAADAWNALHAAGITDGSAPQAPLTREQYAAMTQRAARGA